MIGIYFLLYRKRVVYVGQSKNLHDRIKSHKDKKFDSVRLIECGESKLLHYERRWIQLFEPKYNKTHKYTIADLRKKKSPGLITFKFDKDELRMLSRMCKKNDRKLGNQITFAVRQQYFRQFNKKKFYPEYF